MSIVSTVKVYDGIVLGAESMTQLTATVNGQQQLIKSYEHAQKIFRVGSLPVGVLTYGAGNIGRRSIESFVREFTRSEEAKREEAVDVEQIATRFLAFMRQHYLDGFGAMQRDQLPVMGFMVAGYSDGKHLASEWEFILPQDDKPKPVRGQDEIGASWRGVGGPFTRLWFGVDPSLEQLVLNAGGSQPEVDRIKRMTNENLQTRIAFDGMPLQDAVNFCKFIIQTTVGWCTYAIGSPACGGPIKLATITPGSGFNWVTPPKLYLEGAEHA